MRSGEKAESIPMASYSFSEAFALCGLVKRRPFFYFGSTTAMKMAAGNKVWRNGESKVRPKPDS